MEHYHLQWLTVAKVNISTAAKLAGISRVTLYKKHIQTGQISVDKDPRGRPVIDTSELLRVFGSLYTYEHNETVNVLHEETPEETQKTDDCKAKIAMLETLLEQQKQELRHARDEISWLRQRIEATEQKQLAGPETRRRWWWPW